MRSLRLGLVALLLSSVMLVSCSRPSKLEPREFDYSGTWKGSLVDDVQGDGTITATLNQDVFSVGGTWYSYFGDDSASQNGGSLTGQIFVGEDTDQLNIKLKPQVSNNCAYDVTLIRTDDKLAGKYEPSSGTDCHAGTVRMTKQP